MSFNNTAMASIAIYNRLEKSILPSLAHKARENLRNGTFSPAVNEKEILRIDISRKLLLRDILKFGVKVVHGDDSYELVFSKINDTIEVNVHMGSNDPNHYAYTGGEMIPSGINIGHYLQMMPDDTSKYPEHYFMGGTIPKLRNAALFFSRHTTLPIDVNEDILDAICKIFTGHTLDVCYQKEKFLQEEAERQQRIQERAEEVWEENVNYTESNRSLDRFYKSLIP